MELPTGQGCVYHCSLPQPDISKESNRSLAYKLWYGPHDEYGFRVHSTVPYNCQWVTAVTIE